MKPCPFCHVSPRDHLVAESGMVKVIFSNPRLVKGHLLIIPKRHVEQPWELTGQEQIEVLAFITKFQRRLSQTIGTGCDVRQNYRPFLIQGKLKVDHVHYHLLPRKLEDELYTKCQIYEKEIFINLCDSEIAEVEQQLKGI
jgi:ATP adenylyltransferase